MRRRHKPSTTPRTPRRLSHPNVEDWGTTLAAATAAHARAYRAWCARNPGHTTDPVLDYAQMREFHRDGHPAPRWRANGYPGDPGYSPPTEVWPPMVVELSPDLAAIQRARMGQE